MKNKYYIIVIAVVLLALVGYHYYAAGEAAEQIDKALQEQSGKQGNYFAISYDDIGVHPFSGDIEFQEINLAYQNNLYQASQLNFDQTYLDFLRFYIGGAEFGLRKLNKTQVQALSPSFEDQSTARVISSSDLEIDYEGNLYDLLRHLISGQSVEQKHKWKAWAQDAKLTQSGPGLGSFLLDSLYLENRIPAEAQSLLDTGYFLAKAHRVQWIPPSSIQEQYAFFIRGFGYSPDSITIDSTMLRITPGNRSLTKNMSGELHTDLFLLRSTAQIELNPETPAVSTFSKGTVSLPEVSKRFKSFLQNSEQLFGVTLPVNQEAILHYRGPVTNPQFSF